MRRTPRSAPSILPVAGAESQPRKISSYVVERRVGKRTLALLLQRALAGMAGLVGFVGHLGGAAVVVLAVHGGHLAPAGACLESVGYARQIGWWRAALVEQKFEFAGDACSMAEFLAMVGCAIRLVIGTLQGSCPGGKSWPHERTGPGNTALIQMLEMVCA